MKWIKADKVPNELMEYLRVLIKDMQLTSGKTPTEEDVINLVNDDLKSISIKTIIQQVK